MKRLYLNFHYSHTGNENLKQVSPPVVPHGQPAADIKYFQMKKNISQGRPRTVKKQSPENKDNLDSRKNEEQDFKGDDVTHNKKVKRRKRESNQ